MSDPVPHPTSRRRVLAGLGAVIVAPAVIAATGSAAAAEPEQAAPAPAPTVTPECLSDLVAMGVA